MRDGEFTVSGRPSEYRGAPGVELRAIRYEASLRGVRASQRETPRMRRLLEITVVLVALLGASACASAPVDTPAAPVAAVEPIAPTAPVAPVTAAG